MRFRNNPGSRGSILVLTLWVMGLLSVFAVYLGINVRGRLEFLQRMETRNKLYLTAEAGAKQAIAELGKFRNEAGGIGLHQSWSSNSGVFENIFSGNGYYDVGYPIAAGDFSGGDSGAFMFGAEDVQARININFASAEILAALIENVGELDARTALTIAQSIIDWRDPGDELSGAESAEDRYYRTLRSGYRCKNSSFESIEELGYIKGMDKALFSRLSPYLTIHGSGRVNINTASYPVLSALGFGDSLIEKIIFFRCGADGDPATKDDGLFTSADAVVAQLSQAYALTPEETAQLSNVVSSGQISVNSEVFLICSVARLEQGPERCLISCVFLKNMQEDLDRPGWILEWRTKYAM